MVSESGVAVLSLTAHFSVCPIRGFMKSRTNGHNKLQQWKYSAKLSSVQPSLAPHTIVAAEPMELQMQMSPEEKRGDMYLCPENI